MSNAIGIVGLGVMGTSLARNFANNGYAVAGFDLSEDSRARFDAYDNLSSYGETSAFVQSLEVPRKVIVLVPSSAVDAAISSLTEHLDEDDIIIDMGNSYYKDTERRYKDINEQGFHFIGSGVSGGERGALEGPSMMPGGNESAYQEVAKLLEEAAAVAEGEPCVDYMGERSAGHYVKMVHNGIEYAIMQILAEAYQLLRTAIKLNNPKLAQVFTSWNEGELNSYLVEITGNIFDKKDDETDQYLIDVILDEAKQKGTGRWTSESALELGVATPTINAAVEARIISGLKEERVAASDHYASPSEPIIDNSEAFIEKVRQAVFGAVIASYTQGIRLIQAASQEYDYNVDIVRVLKVWRAGCIIRSSMLKDLTQAYQEDSELTNTMLAPYFQGKLADYSSAWRDVIGVAAQAGVAVPALATALFYYDAYHSSRLPANLTQAQRDYFGSHTYRRLDKDGSFHTQWEE